MSNLDTLLSLYGESHQNKINKSIHWICVPTIMFSLIGMFMQIPFPDISPYLNWGTIILIGALIYYLRLSISLSIGFLIIGVILMYANLELSNYCKTHKLNTIFVLLGIFVIAWIGQFIGHAIEGKRPSFFQDLQFLLIGPAWLMKSLVNNK